MLTINPIFTNGMILQGNKKIKVFGKGKGRITVKFDGESAEAVACGDSWEVTLSPHCYGGPYTMTVTLDGKATEINDIYVGDVYFLGGQSNMQFKMFERREPSDVYEDNESVRLFTIDRMEKTEDEHWGANDGWVNLTKENAPYFSAIGYYFSCELSKHVDRKIGLIACYQGASVIQSWLRRDIALRPELQVENKFADHEWFPIWNDDGVLYDFMMTKVIPYQLKCVLWYQGESNASIEEARIYLRFLDALTSSWREAFEDSELEFIVIQLADYIERDTEGWHLVQEAQLKAEVELRGVKTVVCRDICENDDIHPRSKKELSLRIARAVLEK